MSSITWNDNRLMQSVGTNNEQLGHISLDENSGTYVVWLKDTCGVLGLNGGDIRGDEFGSMEEAKSDAASSPSVFIMHYIWMRAILEQQLTQALEENWDEIAPELEEDVEQQTVRARLIEFLDQAAVPVLTEMSKKIAENVIAKTLVEIVKNYLP